MKATRLRLIYILNFIYFQIYEFIYTLQKAIHIYIDRRTGVYDDGGDHDDDYDDIRKTKASAGDLFGI